MHEDGDCQIAVKKKKNKSSRYCYGSMGIGFIDSASQAVLFVFPCSRKMP